MGPLSKVISLELFLDPVLLRILSALVDAFVKDLVTLTGLTSKRQTAKLKLSPSVFSSLNSRVKIFVFVANSRRHVSIFM